MGIIDFLQTLAFAGAIALIAIVYRYILLREKILHWFYRFGERYSDRWFFDPIWGCHKCIAGQMALWGYLAWKLFGPASTETIVYATNLSMEVQYVFWGSYSIVGHIFAICAAILFSNIIKTTFYRWIN